MARKSPTFVSLFSGCGGMDLGFEWAGFKGLLACDIDPLAIAVHSGNLKTPSHVIDLGATSSADAIGHCPDVVIAGPPCQGFSTLGKRVVGDPRNRLVIAAARLAVALNPKAIIIENVSGALAGKHGIYWQSAERILESAGFVVETRALTSADFGVAQIRRRVVLVAWRGKSDSCPAFKTMPSVRLGATLSGLDGVANHEPKKLRQRTTDYLIARRIRPYQKLCNVRGGSRAIATWEIPEVFGETSPPEREILQAIQKLRRQLRLRKDGDADPLLVRDVSKHLGYNASKSIKRLLDVGYLRQLGNRIDLAHTFNGKYRRLSWDYAAPAVDTRFGEPRYFLHPDEHRGFSVREAARIQGFPDDFVFSGSRNTQYRLVGNAVPPPLAQQIALAIRELIA